MILSASQLETYKLCPRRWGFVYLDGRREPFAESANAGTLVHEIIEKHLLGTQRVDTSHFWTGASGRTYETGKIAAAMLENIPYKFGELTQEQVETKLQLVVDGIEYTGRIDLRPPGEIWDQKTTSALRYAKTEEQLAFDIQALVYARWADEDVQLNWNYGQTKGPAKTRRVSLKLLRDDVHEKFQNIVQPVARKVLAAYAHGDKKRLHQNLDACSKFPPKGCPFKGDCVEKKLKLNLVEMLKETLGESPAITEAVVDLINSPESQVPAPTPVPEELPKKARKKPAAATASTETPPAATQDNDLKPIRTLFVQCMPLDNRKLLFAHELIAKAARTVENDLELHHVRLAPYNTGGASLAAQLRVDILDMVEQLDGEVFDLVLMNRTPEGREVEAVLAGLAQSVIMGM